MLQFNLLFMSPLQFLERYLRLSDLHDNSDIVRVSKETIVLLRTKSLFLDYKPSQLAAAAFFIAVWKTHNLNKQTCKPLLQMWNNNIAQYAGYLVADIEPAFNAIKNTFKNIINSPKEVTIHLGNQNGGGSQGQNKQGKLI